LDLSSILTDDDSVWEVYAVELGDDKSHTMHRDSAELHVVAERGRKIFQWLAHRLVENVMACSHAAFLRCLFNFGMSELVPKQPSQDLDRRGDDAKHHAVVKYMGEEESIEMWLRGYYNNCELQLMVIAFPRLLLRLVEKVIHRIFLPNPRGIDMRMLTHFAAAHS
jgi:hypothetical protein